MKIDFIRKLSSRKFWAMVAGFIGSLLVCFNVSDNNIAQIVAVITAFGSIAVYILSEASVDAASLETKDSDDNQEE